MSRKGNCYDNSVMENFFGIMKQEMYYGVDYYSYDELKEKCPFKGCDESRALRLEQSESQRL